MSEIGMMKGLCIETKVRWRAQFLICWETWFDTRVYCSEKYRDNNGYRQQKVYRCERAPRPTKHVLGILYVLCRQCIAKHSVSAAEKQIDRHADKEAP